MAQKAILDNKALENIDLSAYLPKAGGTLTGRIYGNSGNGLEIQSLNTGSWKEGVRIYNNATNGYSVLSLCDESCQNCLALVQNTNAKQYYIDIEKNGINERINIPYKSGTMALSEDTLLKSGGTMTGTLHTSTNGVANGALPLENCTDVRDIINKVRYTNGCMGSLYLTNSSEIWNTWYNYLYIPHREGGNNGGANQDNHLYGTLLLFPMTTQTGTWWSVQYISDNYYIRQH